MELFSLLRQVGAKASSFAFLVNTLIVGTGAVPCQPVAVMKMPFRSHVGRHNWFLQLFLFWIQHGVLAEATLPVSCSDTVGTNTLGILIQAHSGQGYLGMQPEVNGVLD